MRARNQAATGLAATASTSVRPLREFFSSLLPDAGLLADPGCPALAEQDRPGAVPIGPWAQIARARLDGAGPVRLPTRFQGFSWA